MHRASLSCPARASLALAALLVAPRTAAAGPEPAWYSGFENGFPGEFLDYDNGTFTDKDVPNAGKTEAWALVGADVFPEVLAGERVYKGWITDEAGASHRAYPSLHTDIPTPLVNSFWVWLDVDYDALAPNTDWVHLATWGNNPDWDVHTMSVLNRKLEMAHLDWDYVGPEPQPDFPLGKWVRMTAYIHYPPAGDGAVCVWQDGELVLEGIWSKVQGSSLMRTHWGMYAAGSVDHGAQYNDEIQIWTLSEPLADCLGGEPASPYPQPGDTGDSTGDPGDSTGDATTGGDTTTGEPPATTTGPTGGPAPTTGADTGQGDPTSGGPGTGGVEPGTTTLTPGTGSDGASDTAGSSDAAGCGCAADPDGAWSLLGLALVALRRRRPR